MLRKRIQLGLIHAAVAMTLVPINSTLNRVMIKELALSALLVAVLASLPYLLSPIQVAIGSFSDRHPVLGYRRSPYILLGLLLCVISVAVSPQVAFLMDTNFVLGLAVGLLAFGAWGMGFNLATVAYFALASELSGEGGRGRTIAIMFFMMISSIIITAILLSSLLDPYSPEVLIRSFRVVSLVALALGLIGLIRLEPRHVSQGAAAEEYGWGTLFRAVWNNPQARLFFVYLIVLLAALLGQDVLLEPFGGEAFEMSVRETTRITAIWGVCVLVALLFTGFLEDRVSKKNIARWGGLAALLGFLLIVASPLIGGLSVFFLGVVSLGLGTGLSTTSNLSLMLDMTTAGNVGLFIGAWGMANAISRLVGSLLGGAVRDVVARLSGNPVAGYMTVFAILAGFMLVSLLLLRWVDVQRFRDQANEELSLIERTAIAIE
ncbi:MAG: BCD family MFS transporter [Anaerolineales bacterium]|jgi:BCD family chlorophyll transporter-like MFS transporter